MSLREDTISASTRALLILIFITNLRVGWVFLLPLLLKRNVKVRGVLGSSYGSTCKTPKIMESTQSFQIKNNMIKVVFNYSPPSLYMCPSHNLWLILFNRALKLFIAIAFYYLEIAINVIATVISISEMRNTIENYKGLYN